MLIHRNTGVIAVVIGTPCTVPTPLGEPTHHVGNRTPTLMQVNHTSYGMQCMQCMQSRLVVRCALQPPTQLDEPTHHVGNVTCRHAHWHGACC